MTDLVIRPLVAGEETLFDSMPDPLPAVPKTGYADGLAGGVAVRPAGVLAGRPARR